jgi:hypothetical protein
LTGFLQLLRALVAAHFDSFATDFDLDGTLIQFAIARRTGFLDHILSPTRIPEDRVNSVSHCGRERRYQNL